MARAAKLCHVEILHVLERRLHYFNQVHFGGIEIWENKTRVYLVTGGNSGVGKKTARILYSKNAKVHVAARSETKAEAAFADTETDLGAVGKAAKRLRSLEERLDVLFDNAAVQALADTDGSRKRTAQGHEVHLGVNMLGAFLLTKLLTTVLAATAHMPDPQPGSVRVVYWLLMLPLERYGLSKAGNWLQGVEFSRSCEVGRAGYTAGDGVERVLE
ncbi:hypothetical protein LZ30DRAFT_785127 [Colletotrichum cereale]|nr:hypothetical protein LZ30DRAFT_785127 [Colletotrichum cereale]